MFLFQMRNYNDPSLDAEAETLLCQSIEAQARKAFPKIWKITDFLNGYVEKGSVWEKRRRRYRIFGIILFALGFFILVSGLVEPRNPILIKTGIFTIFAGSFAFILLLNRKKRVPIGHKTIARKCLKIFRSFDYTNQPCSFHFDENGINIASAQEERFVSYVQFLEILESEHLWLLTYGDIKKPMMTLLQKKDLISGDANDFLPYIRQKIVSS